MDFMRNKTFVYLFPMIEDRINYTKNLLGCYIGDLDHPAYNNHILLRYKFSGNLKDSYLKFEEEIAECELLETFYDIDDDKKDTVMFVFKVPEEYQQDYNHFIKSEYSKMSEDYKKKIIDFHTKKSFQKNPRNKKILEGILYKTKAAKAKLEKKIGQPVEPNMEFASAWDTEKEIFEKQEKNLIPNENG